MVKKHSTLVSLVKSGGATRFPAWYGPDHHVFVAEDESIAQAQANLYYGYSVSLQRDTDVLDTWFSSALWPFQH